MFILIESLINFVVGVIELLLVLRFTFKLFGANVAAPFVRWLYETTQPLLNPFRNIFPAPQFEGRFLIEFTTLVAIIVYMLFAYLILELISAVRYRSNRY